MEITEPKWLELARKEIGEADFVPPAENPRILEYLKSVQLPIGQRGNDEVAWCSAFANFCMSKAGINGTHSPAARSWLNWGKVLGQPKPGAITILSRGTSTWEGHVAFFIEKNDASHITLLGGNQGQRVCIEKFSSAHLLGYRWPE